MTTMQRRHYEAIASIVKGLFNAESPTAYPYAKQRRAEAANHFANELRQTNSQFNVGRFLRACGVEE